MTFLPFVFVPALGLALGLCPDAAQHETAPDCPWAAIARAANSDPAAALAEHAPTIWRDVEADHAKRALHGAWGQSRNFDEHVKAPIVNDALLSSLGKRLGVSGDGQIVHAGLQHTYGYLFSTLWTPYGYKRARWVDGELERGLRLLAGMLGPTPPSGTLYENVTCVLAQLTSLRVDGCRVHVTVTKHDVLYEHAGTVTLRTDLVPLGDRILLIYSSVERGQQHLLTSFPVDRAVADRVRALPKRGPIEARYNAFVPTLLKSTDGTRELTSSQ